MRSIDADEDIVDKDRENGCELEDCWNDRVVPVGLEDEVFNIPTH
jgi:hypothetical protein